MQQGQRENLIGFLFKKTMLGDVASSGYLSQGEKVLYTPVAPTRTKDQIKTALLKNSASTELTGEDLADFQKEIQGIYSHQYLELFRL